MSQLSIWAETVSFQFIALCKNCWKKINITKPVPLISLPTLEDSMEEKKCKQCASSEITTDLYLDEDKLKHLIGLLTAQLPDKADDLKDEKYEWFTTTEMLYDTEGYTTSDSVTSLLEILSCAFSSDQTEGVAPDWEIMKDQEIELTINESGLIDLALSGFEGRIAMLSNIALVRMFGDEMLFNSLPESLRPLSLFLGERDITPDDKRFLTT